MDKLKQEEEERLRVIAEPLRHYLAKHVFPTLTQALLDVAKLRPNDSVDYLVSFPIFHSLYISNFNTTTLAHGFF